METAAISDICQPRRFGVRNLLNRSSTHTTNSNQGQTVSPYLQDYTTFMEDVQADVQLALSTAEKLLRTAGILQVKCFEAGTPPIAAHLTKLTREGSVITYSVRLGRYLLNVTVLNVASSASFTERKRLLQSTFGDIFAADGSTHTLIKRINLRYGRPTVNSSLRDIEQHRRQLTNAVVEYCFNRICSALKIGPKVPNDSFDLVFFDDAVQFRLERCQAPVLLEFTQAKLAHRLKYCLRLLHGLGFVHKDVKPGNVAYSCAIRDFVLIDFGMSQFVKEGLGFKSRTYREGTHEYMSVEMRNLLLDGGLVDLYYNDAWALRVALEKMGREGWSFEWLSHRAETPAGIAEDQAIRMAYEIYSRSKVKHAEASKPALCYAQRVFGEFFPELQSGGGVKKDKNRVNARFIPRLLGDWHQIFMFLTEENRTLLHKLLKHFSKRDCQQPTQKIEDGQRKDPSQEQTESMRKVLELVDQHIDDLRFEDAFELLQEAQSQELNQQRFGLYEWFASVLRGDPLEDIELLIGYPQPLLTDVLVESAVIRNLVGDREQAFAYLRFILNKTTSSKPTFRSSANGEKLLRFLILQSTTSQRKVVLLSHLAHELSRQKEWMRLAQCAIECVQHNGLTSRFESVLLMYVGCAFHQFKAYREAIPYFLKANISFPPNYSLQFLLADCFSVSSYCEEAVDCYQRCLELLKPATTPSLQATSFKLKARLLRQIMSTRKSAEGILLMQQLKLSLTSTKFNDEEMLLIWVKSLQDMIYRKSQIPEYLLRILNNNPCLLELATAPEELVWLRTEAAIIVGLACWGHNGSKDAVGCFQRTEKALKDRIMRLFPLTYESLVQTCTNLVGYTLLAECLETLPTCQQFTVYMLLFAVVCRYCVGGDLQTQPILATLVRLQKVAPSVRQAVMLNSLMTTFTYQLQKHLHFQLSLTAISNGKNRISLQEYDMMMVAYTVLNRKEEAVRTLSEMTSVVEQILVEGWELLKTHYLLRMSHYHTVVGQQEKSKRCLQEVAAIFLDYERSNPENHSIRKQNVRELMDRMMFEEAVELLSSVREWSIASDIAWMWVAMGICQLKLERGNNRAIFYLTKGMSHAPQTSTEHGEAMFYLCCEMLNKNQRQRVLTLARKLIEKQGRDSIYIERLRLRLKKSEDWKRYFRVLFAKEEPISKNMLTTSLYERLSLLASTKRFLKWSPRVD